MQGNPRCLKVPQMADTQDVFNQSPPFVDVDLGGAYQFAQSHFGGTNLYMDALRQNIRFVERLRDQGDIVLRRQPPSTCH